MGHFFLNIDGNIIITSIYIMYFIYIIYFISYPCIFHVSPKYLNTLQQAI